MANAEGLTGDSPEEEITFDGDYADMPPDYDE